MKIFKIAQQQFEIERYIPKNKLREYRELKIKFNNLSNQFVAAYKIDKQSGELNKKSDKILEQMQELDKQIVAFEKHGKEMIEKERNKYIEQKKQNELRTEQRYKNVQKIGNELESYVRKYFGLTDNIYLAGYILYNGDMLRMSHDGSQRDIDHRQVCEAFPDKIDIDSGTDGMNQFMLATGAIRVNASRGSNIMSFDFKKVPSSIQMKKIIKYLEKVDLEISMNHDVKIFSHGEEKEMAKFIGYKGYLW